MIITEKEKTLLEDIKAQEQLCVQKYSQYEQEAHDPGLKQLFAGIESEERQHYDTISQILGGSVPSMNSGSPNIKKDIPTTPAYSSSDDSEDKKHDQYLCTDCLGTEKHVASVYNTGIFESKDSKIRDALNHIQKEEQEHGKQLCDYMTLNSMC